eukprot:CAMPEP_0173418018 /NCGR_PEP_ID=MMETSP1357-20121228/248_1 /TAXON_ID=77926 /ORGANISM="Hemiselmis rufescens, Strain PCC563" /LENGTH=96 /DNA_ID=CAMNT_0014380423 /DNA_START=79 /DNA_END=369 /DNA_ORIENTATION=+
MEGLSPFFGLAPDAIDCAAAHTSTSQLSLGGDEDALNSIEQEPTSSEDATSTLTANISHASPSDPMRNEGTSARASTPPTIAEDGATAHGATGSNQ